MNTEGYSRQSVEQRANDSAYWSANQWGAGVHAAAVRRNYDKFATNEFNITTSALAHAQTRNGQLTLLDDMMSHSAKKIPENMNEFYGAVKGWQTARVTWARAKWCWKNPASLPQAQRH